MVGLLATTMILDSWAEYRRSIEMIVEMAANTKTGTTPGKLEDMPCKTR